MRLLFQSLVMSFPVALRAALPLLGVAVLAFIVSSILGLFTFGLTSLVSTPITAGIITFIGLRVAIHLGHPIPALDVRMLCLMGGIFGLVLAIAKKVMVTLAALIAVVATEWNLQDLGSLWSLTDAEQSVQLAFALHLMSLNTILSLLFMCIVPALLAVPMAAAARSVGQGERAASVNYGLGHKFLPLFLISVLTNGLLFFFGFFSFLFLTFPLALLSFASSLATLDFANVPWNILGIGLASAGGYLWANAWAWSAAALALRTYERGAVADTVSRASRVAPATSPQLAPAASSATDFRALRKARSG